MRANELLSDDRKCTKKCNFSSEEGEVLSGRGIGKFCGEDNVLAEP